MNAIERLEAFQRNRTRYQTGSALDYALRHDSELRTEVEWLTWHFLNRSVSGCINCYTDAFFELLTIDKTTAMEKEKCVFHLRAGALLKDINGDRSKMVTNANLTNELAIYHLQTNPNCRRFFDRPEDLDAAVAELTASTTKVAQTAEKEAKTTNAAKVSKKKKSKK